MNKGKRVIYVQVLTTKRIGNTAYVALSYSFIWSLEEVVRDDKWYNWTLPLNVVEEMFGCKFKDGRHPYVQGLLDRDELDKRVKVEEAKGFSIWK